MNADQVKEAAQKILAPSLYNTLQSFVEALGKGAPTHIAVVSKVYATHALAAVLRQEMEEMLRIAALSHLPTMPSEEEFAKVDVSDLNQLMDAISVLLNEAGTRILRSVLQRSVERN